MNNNELHFGFSSSINYINENKDPSTFTIYSNKSLINEALEELFNHAIRLNLNPKYVKSITVENDILYYFVENRFLLKECMVKDILKQWQYEEDTKNDFNKDEKARVFSPIKIKDQPSWMKKKSNLDSNFMNSGLYLDKITTVENIEIKYKAGWLKSNGDWMVINLFTGETEFSKNFTIKNLETAINAIQNFTGDKLSIY
jgi:hypothetical protein